MTSLAPNRAARPLTETLTGYAIRITPPGKRTQIMRGCAGVYLTGDAHRARVVEEDYRWARAEVVEVEVTVREVTP